MSEVSSRPSDARLETSFSPRFLVGRIYLLAALLVAEYGLLVSFPHPWSHLHRIVAFCLVVTAVFLFLIPARLRSHRTPLPLAFVPLAFHVACLGLVAWFHHTLLAQPTASPALVASWYAGIVAASLTLLFALLPGKAIFYTLRQTRLPLFYAVAAGAIAAAISGTVLNAWTSPSNFVTRGLQRSTLLLVAAVLRHFYPGTLADPATYVVALPHFGVTVGDACSGIEGLSLTILFCVGWFWYARRELRFPRAFLILPLALLLSYVFNVLRIALILAVGNAGHPDLAIQSIHSEAGWIAFNFIALSFLAITSRLDFFLRPAGTAAKNEARQEQTGPDAASLYLLPFLAFLGTGFLTRALSPSGVEWLYPLRLVACTVVFLLYRQTYRRFRWDFGWPGLATGLGVFLLWVPLAHRFGAAASPSYIQALHAAPPAARYLWMVFRILGSVLFVPVLEELAFRGFLLRRLVSADFLAVRYTAVSALSLILSSVAFGLMHGKLWLAGTLAGLAFGLLAKRTGRIAPAITAHATANLLLCVWVLLTGDWGLW